MTRFVRALAAAAVVAVLVAGVPLVLFATVGDPRTGWGDLAVGDVSDTALLGVLATLAWLAWGFFTITLVGEAKYQLGHWLRYRRVPPPQETTLIGGRLARALLTAIMTALPLAAPVQAFAATPTHAAVLTSVTARTSAGGVRPSASSGSSSSAQEGERTPARVVYDVRAGDQLGAIAERYLGRASDYSQIRAANDNLMPTRAGARGPDHIFPGWQLVLPSGAHDRGPLRHAAGHTRDGKPELPRKRPAHSRIGSRTSSRTKERAASPTPSPARSTDTVQPRTPPTSRHLHPVGPSVLPATQPAEGANHHDASHISRLSSRPGFPGGWLDLQAAALTAGVGALWLRRRRRAKALDLVTDDGLVDGDDASQDGEHPMAADIARLRQLVREHAAHPPVVTQHRVAGPIEPTGWDATSWPPATANHEAGPAPAPDSQPALPPEPGDEDERSIGLPADVLVLCGTGAMSAGRALLIDVLSADGTHPATGRGAAVTTSHLVRDLLPGWRPTPTASGQDVTPGADHGSRLTGVGDRLVVARDGSQALVLVEEEVNARHRGAQMSAGGRAPLPPEYLDEPTPLVLITQASPGRAYPRLRHLAQVGAAVGVHVVMIDQNPATDLPGPTVSVDADGHVVGANLEGLPEHLTVLDEDATLSLLDDQPRISSLPGPREAGEDPSFHQFSAETSAEPTPTSIIDPNTDPQVDHHADASPPAQHAPKIPVRVLGPPAVLDPNDLTPQPSLRTHARELLVYLVVRRHGAKLPDIMEALWPDATVGRAQQQLSTEAANLRKTIRVAAGNPDLQPLINTGGHYHLDPDVLDVDLWNLFDHLDAATATSNPLTRAPHLQATLAIQAGELAEGTQYEWIEAPREQVRRQRIRGLIALTEQPDVQADHAARLAEAAADLDPASEDLAQRAMKALAAIGDADGVQSRYRILRRALAEISERPSEQTSTLVRELETDNITG